MSQQQSHNDENLTRRSFLKGALVVSAGAASLLKCGARGVLAQGALAQSTTNAAKPVLYLVATAHNDTQWNWTVQNTIREWIPNTMRPNWELMRKYPAYNFNYEATIHYGWFKEYHPEDWKELQDWVAKDRWKLSGSWVNAVDVIVPSPESLFRQALYGQAFFRREFGKVSRDIYLPDCFGFPYSLPSIARHSGLISFSTQKFDLWGGFRPAPFSVGRWQGVDGSQIVAELRPKAYNTKLHSDIAREPNWTNDFTDAGGQPVNQRYFGTGDTGGTPGEESVSWAQKAVEDKSGIARVVNTSADQLAKDLTPAQIAALPVYNDELVMTAHGTGCYTSQAAMKKWNRQNEQLGDAAERASLAAQWLGGAPYPREVLNEAWLRVLWHQFHDDITGTSIPQAYTFSWNDEILSLNQFSQLVTTGVSGIARSLDTRVEGLALAVYNPLDRARRDCVEATVFLPLEAEFVRVFDTATNREVPCQILSRQNKEVGSLMGREFHIAFVAGAPSVGVQIYDVRPSNQASALSGELSVSETTIENALLRVQLSPTGDIAGVFDKRTNLELLSAPATLEHFHDVSNTWPAWEVLWDAIGQPPRGTVSENVQIAVIERGPARVALEVRRSLGDTVWVQRLRLTPGSEWLELDNEVDWRSPATLVKAAFPMSVANPVATFDMGLGTIERPNAEPHRYEVPAQNWANLSNANGRGGMAILTSTKYGFDKPDDSTLRLTLLRTPEGTNYPHQRTNDIGHHRFSYALAPHAGDWHAGDIQNLAARFNQPLRAFQTASHAGNGRAFSLLHLNTAQVGVRALKQAEDSDEWVIRLHELHGRSAQNVRVSFGSRVRSAREINAAEEAVGPYPVQNGELVANFSPYQPRTFAVRLAASGRRVRAPRSRAVALPFDVNGVSTHGNLGASNFDGTGQSFAGELWPTHIERDGLRFELGKADEANFVECRGQTIALPKGNYSRAVLLATSIGGDARGEFGVGSRNGTTRHVRKVADWTQHVGQWDSRLSNPWQGSGGGQIVREVVDGRVQRLDRLKPAYVKRDQVAWIGTHRHFAQVRHFYAGGGPVKLFDTPQTQPQVQPVSKGDQVYLFSYLFQVALDLPRGATHIQLPDNPNIRIAALTLARDTFDDTRAAGALFEPHLSDATLPAIAPRPPANTRVFGPTSLQTFDGTHDFSRDELLELPTTGTDSWTMNMFVFLDQAPDTLTMIAGFGDARDEHGAQRFIGRIEGGIQFWGSGVDIDSGVPFDLGRWQMLSATYDGQTVTVFKNGEPITSAPAVLSDASAEVRIAPSGTWEKEHRFAGRIEGLAIWNSALSPSAIAALLTGLPKN